MSISTWNNITTGMHTATHTSYTAKSSKQRSKPEVVNVMADVDAFCVRKQEELRTGTYRVGKYRHFLLKDRKKPRNISVLPYDDRCVQNDIKDAIQPIILRYTTDDMLGGLPGCGVLSKNKSHQVIARMKVLLADKSLEYCLQGDISKFYDNVDNVVSMRLIERKVKDTRTRVLIRMHLFNQKKLAIGDPFSHLIANMNMSVIIRKAKRKYGRSIRIINFADDFIAFSKDKETLKKLRRDMNLWAREMRLHFKPMYVHNVDKEQIIFCGMKYTRDTVRISQRTKKRYVRHRHSRRSMGSYNGILQKCDTKKLRYMVERNDNRHMGDKIRRPFAGKVKKIEQLEGIRHTIVNVVEKPSRQQHSETYMHVQAIADGLGLIVYSTSSTKIVEFLKTHKVPMRDMVIAKDWSGYYYEGTVYTDEEEEEMIRRQFNIQKK